MTSQSLRDLQQQMGAIFGEGPAPSSFGNDAQAIAAARNGVALVDLSDWGLLQLSGDDRLRFLHNQTTNNINRLQPGQGCHTVFVTSTGRTLDLAIAYATEEAILVLVSPNRRQLLFEWMNRYIFPFDRVQLRDLSNEVAIFALIGPDSEKLLQSWNLENWGQQPEASHALIELEGISVRMAVGCGLGLPGLMAIAPRTAAVQLWQALTETGAIPLGRHGWEKLRIQQGRPAPERELTEDYNPLEAGLWQAISFEKGCYIGQETIARLNTYKGVKQRLWGVKLQSPVTPGTPVAIADSKVGILTSCAETEAGPVGLAYVRTKAGEAGTQVQVGETSGELVAVPFLTHEYYQPQK